MAINTYKDMVSHEDLEAAIIEFAASKRDRRALVKFLKTLGLPAKPRFTETEKQYATNCLFNVLIFVLVFMSLSEESREMLRELIEDSIDLNLAMSCSYIVNY